MITNPTDPTGLNAMDQASQLPPITNPHLAVLDRSWAQLPDDTKDVVNRAHELLGLRGASDGAAAVQTAASQPTGATADAQAPAAATPPLSKISNPTEERLLPSMMGVTPSSLGISHDGTRESMKRFESAQASGASQSPQPASPAEEKMPIRSDRISTAPPNAMSPLKQEQARLNAPPLEGIGSHTKADTGLSGVDQIHNPWARVPLQILNAIGSGLFPNIAMGIPGTSAHHQLLVNQNAGAVSHENKQREDDAKAAQETATTRLTEAQIPHVEAETTALGNPKDEFALFHKQNPNGTVTDFVKQREDGKNPTSPYQIWHKEPANAGKGYIDFLKAESGSKPPTNELELYIRTHPDEANQLAGFENEKQNLTSHPLTKETAATMNANYNTLGKQYKGIPLDQFHEGMTSAEATQIKAAMLGAIAGTQKGQNITINQGKADNAASGKRDAETSKEFVRVNKRLTTGYDKLQSQMDNLDAADKEINGAAPAQALGIIKTIVATAGGAGSGVRITQAELNSLTKARNLGDSFEAWMQKFTSGKSLAPEQVSQIKDMLHGIRQTADAKHQTYLDSLDKLNGARSVQEVRQIESDFNHAHGEGQAPTGGHKIQVGDKTYQYKGSGATDDMSNYAEVTKK